MGDKCRMCVRKTKAISTWTCISELSTVQPQQIWTTRLLIGFSLLVLYCELQLPFNGE